ncbi:MAG: hypothetical protein IJS03_02425 [Eubacterium sp.]|nr:hypothetical protein [Eubacterium sp.]
MADKLTNGDYTIVSGEKALEQIDYINELLQNAFVLLKAKRGRFYPNKDFGSLIYSLDTGNPEKYIEAFAQQALDKLDGVFVKSAVVDSQSGAILINLLINDTQGQVIIEQ